MTWLIGGELVFVDAALSSELCTKKTWTPKVTSFGNMVFRLPRELYALSFHADSWRDMARQFLAYSVQPGNKLPPGINLHSLVHLDYGDITLFWEGDDEHRDVPRGGRVWLEHLFAYLNKRYSQYDWRLPDGYVEAVIDLWQYLPEGKLPDPKMG